MEQQEYAGFWLRSTAYALDLLLALILFSGPLWLMESEQDWDWQPVWQPQNPWQLLLNYLLPLITTVSFWLRYLATPGKLVTGLKIVDAKSGGKMSLKQAMLRYAGYPLALLPMGLGILWIIRDPRKQGWHDKLAGTVVIRERQPALPYRTTGPG